MGTAGEAFKRAEAGRPVVNDHSLDLLIGGGRTCHFISSLKP